MWCIIIAYLSLQTKAVASRNSHESVNSEGRRNTGKSRIKRGSSRVEQERISDRRHNLSDTSVTNEKMSRRSHGKDSWANKDSEIKVCE